MMRMYAGQTIRRIKLVSKLRFSGFVAILPQLRKQ
jgi:hypothetical protein